MTKQTQEARILGVLEAGQMISPLGAWKRFGCERLAARIYDLRRKGYRIEMELVKTPSGAHVAEYWMEGK
jgi:hypothetical protein